LPTARPYPVPRNRCPLASGTRNFPASLPRLLSNPTGSRANHDGNTHTNQQLASRATAIIRSDELTGGRSARKLLSRRRFDWTHRARGGELSATRRDHPAHGTRCAERELCRVRASQRERERRAFGGGKVCLSTRLRGSAMRRHGGPGRSVSRRDGFCRPSRSRG
jgi:hypothetical protein